MGSLRNLFPTLLRPPERHYFIAFRIDLPKWDREAHPCAYGPYMKVTSTHVEGMLSPGYKEFHLWETQ